MDELKKAVIFIFIKDHLLLLEKRTFGQVVKDHLVFLGGTLNEGETLKDCLLREVKEELGIIPLEYEELILDFKIFNKRSLEITPFIVKTWEGEIPQKTLDYNNELFWIPLDDALNSPLEQVKKIASAVKTQLNPDG